MTIWAWVLNQWSENSWSVREGFFVKRPWSMAGASVAISLLYWLEVRW